MPSKGRIAIDFDGVINSYTSGFSPYRISDPPVNGSIDFIRMLLNNDYSVSITSTRNTTVRGINLMKKYLRDNGLSLEEVGRVGFPKGKPIAILYIDDRGYHFDGVNWPSLEFISSFRPWTFMDSSSKV
jgi:hypothetical protein